MRRTQADVQAHLTRLLLADEVMTASQAVRRLGCCDGHARKALAALHEAKLIHIAMWRRFIVGGPWVAVYAWCGLWQLEDEPHPRMSIRSAQPLGVTR